MKNCCCGQEAGTELENKSLGRPALRAYLTRSVRPQHLRSQDEQQQNDGELRAPATFTTPPSSPPSSPAARMRGRPQGTQSHASNPEVSVAASTGSISADQMVPPALWTSDSIPDRQDVPTPTDTLPTSRSTDSEVDAYCEVPMD